MKTNEVLKRAAKIYGAENANLEFNYQAGRWVKCLQNGTLYAVMVRSSYDRDVVKFIQVVPENRYYYNFNAFLLCMGYKVNKNNNVTLSGGNTNTVTDVNRYILRSLADMGVITYELCRELEAVEIPRIFA